MSGSSKAMPRSVCRVVVARDLVRDVCHLARDAEAVRKPDRDEDLLRVLVAQLEGLVPAVGRGSLAQVDGDVVDRAARDPDQLRLAGTELEVERPDRPAHRAGVVVLHELGVMPSAANSLRRYVSKKKPRSSANTFGWTSTRPSILVSSRSNRIRSVTQDLSSWPYWRR